jgi:hypothetical protein
MKLPTHFQEIADSNIFITISLELVAKPHKHFLNVMLPKAGSKKVANILI